jgi:RNA polymerase sigma-70 factor, ECF subfamily
LKAQNFEQQVMPHLNAAYNLAYWMTSSDTDAQDVVQEACLRAFKYFDTFAGENAAAWLLTIVRRTCYTWLRRNRGREEVAGVADDSIGEPYNPVLLMGGHGLAQDPESLLIEARENRRLHDLIASLPAGYREVIVLREMEELSYRDIAEVTGIPIGTVMSRLARARAILQSRWRCERQE